MSYLPYDEYVGRYIAEQRVRAGIREAEIRCLLREAGPKRQRWLSCWARRLLGHLGHLLVSVGKRLERYAVPPVAWNTATNPRSVLGRFDVGARGRSTIQ